MATYQVMSHEVPVIGFISFDTTPDFTGAIKPQIVSNYDGMILY
jgi:hypothetical protein